MEHGNSKIKPLSIKKNSMWNAIGSIVYALTQWGVLMTIAKLGNPEMVGIFTLGLALTAPIVLLMRFNLRVAVASDSNSDFQFSEYFSSRVIATVVFLITMSVVSILYSSDYNTALVILILSFAKSIESISDILHGQMQKHERLDMTAKSQIIKGLLSLGIFAYLMYITGNLVLSTLGFMVSWLLILIVYDFKNVCLFGEITFTFNKQQQLRLLKLTIPLGLAQLIASLNANVPRYFIESVHGAETLGFFAAIIYITTAGNNIIMAIGGATIPRLSRFYQQKNIRDYVKLITAFLLLIVLGGIVALVIVKSFGGKILGLLYTPEYVIYTSEFFLFMLVGVIMYIGKFLETGLTATRKFSIQPYINILILLIILTLSYMLIPRYGLAGAGYTLLIAEVVQVIIRGGILTYLLKQRYV